MYFRRFVIIFCSTTFSIVLHVGLLVWILLSDLVERDLHTVLLEKNSKNGVPSQGNQRAVYKVGIITKDSKGFLNGPSLKVKPVVEVVENGTQDANILVDSAVVLNNFTSLQLMSKERLAAREDLVLADAHNKESSEHGVQTDDYGNDTLAANTLYTRQLSMWVANHLPDMNDILYSKDSYCVMRMIIDRKGFLIDSGIFVSTGYEGADDLLIDAMKHSMPAPSVPDDYMPGKDKLAFLIPIYLRVQ